MAEVFARKGLKAGQLSINLLYRDQYLNQILLKNYELLMINKNLNEKVEELSR